MQPDALAEARAWLQKASNDLRGADIDLAASPPLLEDALFHCQQAAEKSMKGSVEKSRQRRSRHFSVLTYLTYVPCVKIAAALLDGLF